MVRNYKREKKEIRIWMTRVFCLLMIVLCGINLLKKDKPFSETENRMLEGKPKLSVGNVISGKYMEQYTSYKSDQFVGRDFWISMKTGVDYMLGKREENGVYNGKDHYLMEQIKAPVSRAYEENIKAMKQFKEKYPNIPMKMMLVPNAANILNEKLPTLAVVKDQTKLFQKVEKDLKDSYEWLDLTKTMKKHKKEEIYYHTDHHWTTLGAYYAYQEYMKAKDEKELVEFQKYPVTNQFNGTLSSTSGYERNYKERINVYLPKEDSVEYVVEYREEQKKTTTVYNKEKLKEKDKYGMFFDGNHSIVDIKTTAASDEKLLILKDSYANCFVPFLIPYYREIMMIDPRYYYGDLYELLDSENYSEVLFLYNGNTFFEDNSISGVLDAG